MSRSLHHTHRPRSLGLVCPFLPAHSPPSAAGDLDCGVASADHPGGICPARLIGSMALQEGDLTVSRDTPPDYARRYAPHAFSTCVTADNRAVRRAVTTRLHGLRGRDVADAADAWDDDPHPLPHHDPGIAWLVY